MKDEEAVSGLVMNILASIYQPIDVWQLATLSELQFSQHRETNNYRIKGEDGCKVPFMRPNTW